VGTLWHGSALTVLVVDASVWLASLDTQDTSHAAARDLVVQSSRQLIALDLTFYEVASVASRWPSQQLAALADRLVHAGAAEVIRVDVALASEARELASTSKLSAYDAAYVCAARARGLTLVSLDVRDLVRPGYAVLPENA
jgi:predicted nucleic acid-binding protein